MGIDEAGRGPTLGPMVYGSAFCAVEDESKLRGMGFNDSKQLTEAKRDSLWAELQTSGFIGWRIRVLDAAEIAARAHGTVHGGRASALVGGGEHLGRRRLGRRAARDADRRTPSRRADGAAPR